LEVIRSGPHRIKKKVSNVMYVIDSRFKKKESNLFHASKLVPYRNDGNPLPKREKKEGDISLNTGAKLSHLTQTSDNIQ